MKTKIVHSQECALLYSLEDIRDQLKRCDTKFDFFIFSIHPKYGYEDVNFLIKKTFKTKNYIAFHAVDAFNNARIVEEAVVCLAIQFEKNGYIQTFYMENINENSALDKTLKYINTNSDALHIILAGLAEDKFVYFLDKISEGIRYSPVNNIIGGISSGYNKDGEFLTYQFIDNEVIKHGFLIISLKNVLFSMDISLGFIPYGITYTIKKAKNREIFEVDDHKPFSKIINDLLTGIENPDIRYLWYVPIYILDDKEGYVATVRTPASIKKNSVEFYGPVREGDKFKLSFATPDNLISEDILCAKKIKKNLKHVELAFNFSCIARQYVLEDRQEEELKVYASILDSHLFGFFTFGEIGPDKEFKKLKLYNETSLVVGVREL